MSASTKKRGSGQAQDVYIPLYCYSKTQTKTGSSELSEEVITTILDSMPNEVYKPSWGSAVFDLTVAAALTALSVFIFVSLPWFCIPIGWITAATAMTYFFNIGHDCSHKTWTPSQLFNNIIGEIAFLPLIHPYQAFRYKHLNNNKLLKRLSFAPKEHTVVTHPSSLLASLGLRGFISEHYNVYSFPPQFRSRVLLSVIISLVFIVAFFGVIWKFAGIVGVVLYWLVPLVIYKDVLYVRWLNWARRSINFHFSPHVASAVPSYHLRTAAKCVQEVLDRGNKQQEDELRRLHEDAINQKKGADVKGYNHVYGDEVRMEGFKSLAQLIKQLNWVNVIILFGTPVIALYGIISTPIDTRTFIFSIFYYFFTGLGITAGYHRLWAHRAYDAGQLLKMCLLLGGTGALEGSIKWWCGGHRVHHRYTDTPKDPYNAKFGFWWSHMGWMLVKPDSRHKVKADIRDLQSDPWIQFQHKHYAWLGPFMSFVVPSLIAGLGWGDYWGGYFFAGACRQVFVHHSTFCVNSMAHFFGAHTYDDARTPKDHLLTAFVTLGEGYHNFHHEFPNDYRNGIRWFDYDPTKWLIKGCSLFGLSWGLKEFPSNEVMKGKLLMVQKKLDREKAKLIYPGPINALPPYTWEDIQRQVREGCALIVMDGLVHDVGNFIDEHPGGRTYINSAVGEDATARFRGDTGIYKHSNAAKHLLTTFRVGRLVEVEAPSSSSLSASAPAASAEHEETSSKQKVQ